MKRAKLAGSAGMLGLAALTLVACGKNNNADNTNNAKTASRFPSAMPKKKLNKAALYGWHWKQILRSQGFF